MKNNMSKRSRLASDTKWMYEKYPTFTKDLLLALERCDRGYIEKYIQENNLRSVDDFITFRDTPNVRTTLLVEAVRVGGQEAMIFLITKKKADVNKPGHDMKNPLMLATDASNVFMVQRLIALGANVNYPSPSSYITPLVLAIYACHPISEQQPTWEALTVLRDLVAAGADPNGNSAGNTVPVGTYTAFYWALVSNHYEIMNILFNTPGAVPPNMKINFGMNLGGPFHVVARNPHDTFFYASVILLLSRGGT